MKILVLGGTREARELCPRLAGAGHDVTASLAGATRAPAAYRVPTRVGGFGGPAGLADWLDSHRIDCLVDATHPFAKQMPHHAAAAAYGAGIARLRLIRPGWTPRPHWRQFETLDAACAELTPADRVLATTGHGELDPLFRHTDPRFWLRTIEDPGDLPLHVTSIRGRPPFTPAEEQALMQAHGITHLLTKNSGGDGAKLDAADRLGVTVLMIRRPAPPPGPHAATTDAALAWVEALAAHGRQKNQPG